MNNYGDIQMVMNLVRFIENLIHGINHRSFYLFIY